MLRSPIPLAALVATVLAGCGTAPPDSYYNEIRERRYQELRQLRVRDRRPAREIDRRQQECLALALYWEARGEGRLGMQAVGWTVMNRVASPEFPDTACGVVYEGGERPGCQFSWYCDGRSDRPRNWQSWQLALEVADEMLRQPADDPTHGALFYHATSIGVPWRRPRERTTQIGRHVFYR